MFWLLIQVAFYIAGLMLWGANIMVQFPSLCMAAKGNFFGVNLFPIGLAFIVGAMWAGLPKGLTLGQQVKEIVKKLLFYPKAIWAAIADAWKSTPAA